MCKASPPKHDLICLVQLDNFSMLPNFKAHVLDKEKSQQKSVQPTGLPIYSDSWSILLERPEMVINERIDNLITNCYSFIFLSLRSRSYLVTWLQICTLLSFDHPKPKIDDIKFFWSSSIRNKNANLSLLSSDYRRNLEMLFDQTR